MFSDRTNWPLAPNPFTIALNDIRASGVPVLDLTVSNPTQCGLQYDTDAILSAFQNASALSYDPQPKGTLAARREIARYYQDDHQTALDPDSVFLTTSTSEAYSYVFRLLCNPCEQLLVPKPSYPLFDFLAGLQDVHLAPYTLGYAQGWFIDFQSLNRALTPRTRAVLLVHPNNPTGSYVHPEEVPRLNEFCRQHNLALIVDEVFLDFAFDSLRAISFVGNQETLTFTLSGLSKISALPQMKIAWLAVSGPSTLRKPALDRLEIIADTYLSISAPAQLALPVLLAQRHSLRKQLLERIRRNYQRLLGCLRSQSHCELLHAEAGWYAILRAPARLADEDLAIRLLREHHVVVHPGHFYDFPSNGFLILSLITPPETFDIGIERILSYLARLSS